MISKEERSFIGLRVLKDKDKWVKG